jgi:hypothetical protein
MLPLARPIFRAIGPTNRDAPISADVIARAMVRLAFRTGGDQVRIVERDALHTLGASQPPPLSGLKASPGSTRRALTLPVTNRVS